jgi:hypothetical protein
MPKTVLQFLEEGRQAALADRDELPKAIDDADASNALFAGRRLEATLRNIDQAKAAKLYAYDQAIATLKAELAAPVPPVSNDAGDPSSPK